MIKTLFIIAGAGVVLAAGSLAGAAALTGGDLRHNDWTWSVDENDGGGDNFHMRRGGGQPDVTRALAWAGGDRLRLEVPGDVVYVQGAEAGVVVTGPRDLADRVRVVGDRITIDDEETRHVERGYIRWSQNGIHVWSDDDQLKITVTSPSVTSFDVTGSSDLAIRDYDQPRLTLSLSGSGDVTARGAAGAVRIDISGSGDADLGALMTTDADVQVSGSGDVRIGPTGRADIDVSGSGDVDLTRRAETVRRNDSGSGDIDED